MITEFLSPSLQDADPKDAALARGVAELALASILKYEAGGMVVDRLTGEAAHKARTRELSKLEILKKKRELGIPFTDDDLEGYRTESLFDKVKTPAAALIIQQTSPSVFAGIPPAMPVMGEAIPTVMSFPPKHAPAVVMPLPKQPSRTGAAAANSIISIMKLPSKKGIVSSLLKSLK